MEVKPLTGGLGAEIVGADIRCEDQFDAIKSAFAEYSVIALRGQSVSPQEHLTFARRFGPINVNRFFKPVDGHPEIAMVLKEEDQKEAVGEGWHTDHSYDQEPAMGSILHALEVPPQGGDTLFVSMAAAYEALSPTMRGFLDGLWAVHSSRMSLAPASWTQKPQKAAVWVTPKLPRKTLCTPLSSRILSAVGEGCSSIPCSRPKLKACARMSLPRCWV